MVIEVRSEAETKAFGSRLAGLLRGGEVIELVGDVGAGKTTFTKGLAGGLKIDEDVQSPSFTISRVYDAPHGLRLVHYDFYRLHDAGIMAMELQETVSDSQAVTIVEWGEIVDGVLPKDRLTIQLVAGNETSRHITISAGGEKSQKLLEQLT